MLIQQSNLSGGGWPETINCFLAGRLLSSITRRSEAIDCPLTHSIVPSPHVGQPVGLLTCTQLSPEAIGAASTSIGHQTTRRLVGHRFRLSILPLLGGYLKSHDPGNATTQYSRYRSVAPQSVGY